MVAEMNHKDVEIDSQTSRIRAALVNTGRYSFSQAEQKLATSRLVIIIGAEAAASPAGQAAFLTATVTATRCFGQVTVAGRIAEPLLCPLPLNAKSLSEAASLLGARRAIPSESNPRILIGSGLEPGNGWSVQAHWNGWSAGVAPGRNPDATGRGDCALAGVASGALAVGQAFLAQQGDIRAGRFRRLVSLGAGAWPGRWRSTWTTVK